MTSPESIICRRSVNHNLMPGCAMFLSHEPWTASSARTSTSYGELHEDRIDYQVKNPPIQSSRLGPRYHSITGCTERSVTPRRGQATHGRAERRGDCATLSADSNGVAKSPLSAPYRTAAQMPSTHQPQKGFNMSGSTGRGGAVQSPGRKLPIILHASRPK